MKPEKEFSVALFFLFSTAWMRYTLSAMQINKKKSMILEYERYANMVENLIKSWFQFNPKEKNNMINNKHEEAALCRFVGFI